MLSFLLLLQLSFSAPKAFAATSQTTPVAVPSDWTGVEAGTSQTGYPYSSCHVFLDDGSLTLHSVKQTDGYCAIRWDNVGTSNMQSHIELGLVNGGYVLKAGYSYVMNVRVFCSPAGGVSSSVTVEVSAGDFTLWKVCDSGKIVNFEWTVTPDANIRISDLSITVRNSTNTQLMWVYPFRILETNPNQNIIDNQNQNTEEIKNQIQNSASQLQDSISSQTQTITDATEQQTSAIGGFFGNLLNGIISLFVPSQEYFSGFFSEFNDWMEEHFGALYYPISLIVDILQRLAALPVGQQPSITLPGVTIQGQKLWDSTTYTFDFSDGLGLSTIYQLYLTVVDCLLAFALVNLARHKMEQIQRGG